jgi:hypothetical protein
MQQQSSGDDKGNLQKIGEGLGGLMGQAADSVAGMFGTMMSNMGGWWAEASQPQGRSGFTASFDGSRDSACRQHFSGQAQAGGSVRSYDDARPLYQFGHMAGQNPDYQGRSFDQIEMDLQRNWSGEQERRYGAWPNVRGYVQFGYQGSGRSGSGAGSTGGGFQASGSTGGGSGFQASGSKEPGGSAHFDASAGGSSDGGSSGGFKASGEFDSGR